MKSNKWVVVLSIAGIILAIGVIGLTVMNLVGGRGEERGGFAGMLGGGGDLVTQDLDVGDFAAIDIRGGWGVEITGADRYAVSIEAGERYLDQVSATVTNGTLVLDAEGPFRFSRPMRAQITVPDLTRIHVEGGADIDISGLELDALEIINDGAANFEAEDLIIGDLTLRVDGAGNFDLSNARVQNATLDLSGAVNVEITMTGGTLTGSLDGIGNVEYFGDVSDQSVRVQGLGNVQRGN